MKNKNSKSTEDAADEFRNAFDAQNMDGSVSVKDMMTYLSISDKTVYARIKKMDGEFTLEKGRIYRHETAQMSVLEPDL